MVKNCKKGEIFQERTKQVEEIRGTIMVTERWPLGVGIFINIVRREALGFHLFRFTQVSVQVLMSEPMISQQ